MRVVHAAETEPCHECRARADVVVARGHRIWYSCWEHAPSLLENGGVIIAGELASGRR